MDTWSFDIPISSHDLLKEGILCDKIHRITLSKAEFPTHIEAMEFALQMAFRHGYPTDCWTRI